MFKISCEKGCQTPEFKEAFVDAYLKIKGYDQPVEDGLFTRFKTVIHSLFNMPTTQHASY